jgi:hypothetical protein
MGSWDSKADIPGPTIQPATSHFISQVDILGSGFVLRLLPAGGGKPGSSSEAVPNAGCILMTTSTRSLRTEMGLGKGTFVDSRRA